MSDKLAAVELAKVIGGSEAGKSPSLDQNHEYWFGLYAECLNVVEQGWPLPVQVPARVAGNWQAVSIT